MHFVLRQFDYRDKDSDIVRNSDAALVGSPEMIEDDEGETV
jgi:hypothetical protein